MERKNGLEISKYDWHHLNASKELFNKVRILIYKFL